MASHSHTGKSAPEKERRTREEASSRRADGLELTTPLENVSQYLKTVRFRKRTFGGVDEQANERHGEQGTSANGDVGCRDTLGAQQKGEEDNEAHHDGMQKIGRLVAGGIEHDKGDQQVNAANHGKKA